MNLKMSVCLPSCSILTFVDLNSTKQGNHFENNNITEIVIDLYTFFYV